MTTSTDTAETTLILIKELKTDTYRRFDEVDKRFEQVDKRFDQMEAQRQADRADTNKRFDQMEAQRQVDKSEMEAQRRSDKADMEKRFDQLVDILNGEKARYEKMEDKLEKIYESRDRVSVDFTRTWALASMFMAILSSTIVLAVTNAL